MTRTFLGLWLWLAGSLLMAACSAETSPDEVAPSGAVESNGAGSGNVDRAEDVASDVPEDEVPAYDADEPPSFPLRFLEQAAREPVRWEARLIEQTPDGVRSFWTWRVLEEGAPDPVLRYEAIEQHERDDAQVFVEVRQRGGDWIARSEVSGARGVRSTPVEMNLVQVALFGGGVIDGDSNPVMNAELRLYQAEGAMLPVFYSHPHLAWTNELGEFRFGGVEPGNYWLRVVTEGREPVVLNLKLAGGDSEAYELKMTTVETTGELPIAVLGVSDHHLPSTLLAIRSLDGQSVRRVAHPRDPDNPLAQLMQLGVGYAGLFPALPEGRYEVSVLGLDANPYTPAVCQLGFDDLADGLRIQATTTPDLHELRFRVKAKGSDAELRDCYLRFSSDEWWAPESLILQPTEKGAGFAPDMPTPQWMVGRVGFQPAFGTFRAGDGPTSSTIEELELEPGWGCELLFRDGSARLPQPQWDSWRRTGAVHLAPHMAGVVVYADGAEVARSDTAGRVRLQLPSAPKELRFAKAGWQELPAYLTGFLDAHNLGALEAVGSTVVWFDRRE